MKILIVEDDHFQAEWIDQQLRKAFKVVETKIVRTEHDFYEMAEGMTARDFDVIVLDVILQWTTLDRMVEPPEEVKKNGRSRAGIRCWKRLSSNPATRAIPVVLYTVLEEADLATELEVLSQTAVYLPKGSDPKPLLERIKKLIRRP